MYNFQTFNPYYMNSFILQYWKKSVSSSSIKLIIKLEKLVEGGKTWGLKPPPPLPTPSPPILEFLKFLFTFETGK